MTEQVATTTTTTDDAVEPSPDAAFSPNANKENHHSTTTPPPQRQVSALDVSADPFAARQGKTLTWRAVNMTLTSSSNSNNTNGATTTERKLLDNVWGEVPAQQTTAIMGYVYIS